MLIHQRPRATAGRIAFTFERLPVRVGRCNGTAVGTAFIAYDGHGAWWLDQLVLSNPQVYGASIFVPVAHPLFAEVSDRLGRHRDDDIAETIAADLAHGEELRAAVEHRGQGRGGSSVPHVRATRAAVERVVRAQR